MSITSQLPPIALAQASSSLRALAQAAGQTVEARVLSQNANGTTQVQIGRQVLSLTLPQAQPTGATLTLSVQQSDGQLRMALVGVRPPEAMPLGPASANVVPATSVQLSAAALASPAMTVPDVTTAPGGGQSADTPPESAHVTPGVAAGGSPGRGIAMPAQIGPALTPPQNAAAPGAVAPVPTPDVAASIAVARIQPSTDAAVAPGAAPVAVSAGPASVSTGSPLVAPSASAAPAPHTGTVLPSSSAPIAAAPSGAAISGVAPPAPAASVTGRASIPYAVAAPLTPPTTLTGLASSATAALPPVGQAVPAGLVGQHAPSANLPGAVVAAPAASPAATPAPLQPTSPQAALAQMVQQALPRQDSMVGLTTALAAIAGKVALPEPVAKAAQQVLATRLSLDTGKLGGAAIKTAIQQSGVFQEAMLASGQAATGDVKGALLALRQGLGTWLGNQAPVAQVGSVAPPIRGQVPRARAGDGTAVDIPDDPAEVGKLLLERTEAALSRLRLHQNASLPDANPVRQDVQWSMDLPVIVAGQQQILHMQIQRDAEQEAERGEERSWQVRFAINLAERGEVGAQISLRSKNTSVLLWADQEATAQLLAVAVEALREELGEVGLVPRAVVVRAGTPAEQPAQPVGRGSHILDASR